MKPPYSYIESSSQTHSNLPEFRLALVALKETRSPFTAKASPSIDLARECNMRKALFMGSEQPSVVSPVLCSKQELQGRIRGPKAVPETRAAESEPVRT